MSEGTSKKVGGEKKSKEKKERVKKGPMDYTNAVGADGASILNEEGLLTAVPLTIAGAEGEANVYDGWDPKLHKPLTRKNFGSDDVYLRFRVHTIGLQVTAKTALMTKLAKRADRLAQFGDEKTRKKAAKLDRMKEQMAALEAELAAEGITLDED